MALITETITYYRSTYFEIEVNVTPPDGLTADELLFTVKADSYDDSATDTTAIIKKDVALTAGTGTVVIQETDVADTVEPGKYYYSMHVVLSDGNPYPFAVGRFELKADTTNRES
jgi:hypothetical protein